MCFLCPGDSGFRVNICEVIVMSVTDINYGAGHYFECVICHGWSDDGDWSRCICLSCLESGDYS